MSQAVAQMEKVTQTTAATAEESAAASEELSAQADATMRIVRQIAGLVDTAAPREERQPAPAKIGRPSAAVSTFPARAAKPRVISDAEREIPLEATGTYGSF